MRTYFGFAAVLIYAAARSSVILAKGAFAETGSPISDTATQGGIVAVCIGLVYFFLHRGDQLAKATKDAKVAELEVALAAEKASCAARVAGLEERLKVLDIEVRAMRLDWINERDGRTEALAQTIALQKELASLREHNTNLVARFTGHGPDHDRRTEPRG